MRRLLPYLAGAAAAWLLDRLRRDSWVRRPNVDADALDRRLLDRRPRGLP